MIIESVENAPLIWPTIEENGVTRTKINVEFLLLRKFKIKAINIILQVENALLIWPTVEENGVTRTKINVELSVAEKIQDKGNQYHSSRGNNASKQARVVKCYNYKGEGHMARQCTKPKQPRNAPWYKDKAMLVKVLEAGQILVEEKLTFLMEPGVLDGQAVLTIIPNNAAF
nr:hypothetical protein [Tanacetum cinerariifolium]